MVGLAIAGAGNWGKNLVRNFSLLPEVSLKYICDVSPETRKGMATLYAPRVEVIDDLARALDDPGVDAVVLAVDAPRHFELARSCLEAGKHTYVEKPLALKADEARELTETARSRGLKLMVGHLLEYHPAVAYLKDRIADGSIGDPLYLYCRRLNLGIVRQAENAWWSLAPHDISIACYLFEAEPVTVSATGQAYLQEGVEDVVFANLKFADGRMAHIHVSWLDPHKIRKVTLVGSDKMIAFDDMEATEKVRVYDKGARVQRSVDSYVEAITLRHGDLLVPRVPTTEPLRLECRHFIECIEKDRRPRSDGDDGVRVVKVLVAGARSLERGGEPVGV